MSCDACRAEVKRETLHLTVEGQSLCQQCYGSYLSQVARRDALIHEIYRRCSCGAVLTPMGDESVTPYSRGDSGDLDLGFFFQPRKYECNACGTSFKVMHVVIAAIFVGVLAFCSYGLLRASGDDVVLWLLMLAFDFVFVGYDAYCRLRFRRVKPGD